LKPKTGEHSKRFLKDVKPVEIATDKEPIIPPPEDGAAAVAKGRQSYVTELQIKAMQHYRGIGMGEPEIGRIMGLPTSTVHRYAKDVVVAVENVPSDPNSPGPTSIGETPAVPLKPNVPDGKTTVIVGQEMGEPKEPNGSAQIPAPAHAQLVPARQGNGNNGVERQFIPQEFPVDTTEKVVLKIDPDYILDVKGYMQHCGVQDPDMRKWWTNWAVPRLEAMRITEEYWDFPKDGDPGSRVKEWALTFRYHADNSLKYLQAVDELKREAVKRKIAQGGN
jgi:hypothetical protein